MDELEEDNWEILDVLDCPLCNGENLPTITMGKSMHYNCRWCGVWYSFNLKQNAGIEDNNFHE